MGGKRKTILIGKIAVLQEEPSGAATAYFVNATDPGLRRTFDDRSAAEAYFRTVEDGSANSDLDDTFDGRRS
jgi:hypothetical protein